MSTLPPDTELETELQELYIQVRHWQQDLSFLADEARFFRSVLDKYEPVPGRCVIPSQCEEFSAKIELQERELALLKTGTAAFLTFLEPFIDDQKKAMDLGFLEQYNRLRDELSALFDSVMATKKTLPGYAELLMNTNKPADQAERNV